MMHPSRRLGGVFRLIAFSFSFIYMVLAGASPAIAEFALLHPKKDSTLIENAGGTLANGSGPAFFAGRNSSTSDNLRRALLAFDVSAAIPQGSIVTSAVLTLNLTATNGGAASVRLHRVLADWGEGASISSGGGGATTTREDSTWIHRFYDNLFWSQPGGDFDSTPLAVTLVDQPGPYSWGSTAEMVADVQAWLDSPESAHGWILVGDESHPTTVKRFDSRESPDEANRPLLYVEYIPPCSPSPLGPGTWTHQCSDLLGDGEALLPEPAEIGHAEPRFADWILPCTRWILSDLDLPEINPCEALLSDPPRSCEQRAVRKLMTLVMNVCAGHLQTSCPVGGDEGNCGSVSVGDLLQELSVLVRQGNCWRASGCAGVPE